MANRLYETRPEFDAYDDATNAEILQLQLSRDQYAAQREASQPIRAVPAPPKPQPVVTISVSEADRALKDVRNRLRKHPVGSPEREAAIKEKNAAKNVLRIAQANAAEGRFR